MDVKIEESWKALLQEEFDKPYFAELIAFVKNEYAQTRIFPPGKLIFNAFNHCTVDNTKVVILGQDPYHGPGQAHGLCFSVPEGIEQPPSLQNIFKEIHDDLGTPVPVRATWNAGRTRGYCCSMQRLPYGPTRPVRTRTKAGKLSPMPLSARSQKRKNTWYSCCGDPMPNAKAHLSIPTGTWCLNAYTPPRFLPTGADGSAITSSAAQTNIYGNMG